MIGAADYLRELVHRALREFGTGFVIRVGGFADLEKHVGILRCSAQHWVLGRKSAAAMLKYALHINERAHVFFREQLDLIYFVRSAKTIKEMEERNSGFQRGGMGDERQVHGFLHGVGAEHGKARVAAEQNVAVITKNGKRMGRDGARRNV